MRKRLFLMIYEVKMLNYIPHFCTKTYSNTYIVYHPETKKAIIVDPSYFDVKLFEVIKSLDLYITTVLLTTTHHTHLHGVKTIKKIYDCEVYQGGFNEEKESGNFITEDTTLDLLGVPVKALTMEGYSRDTLAFVIEQNIFPGYALECGAIGKTNPPYSKALLIKSIKNKILTLKDNYMIFPARGPLSTLNLEKKYNKELLLS